MKIVDIRQGSPEWYAWRAQGLAASDASVLLGISPYKTAYELWAEMVGLVQPDDLSRNPCVNHGKQFEPFARAWFEEKHQTILLPVCGVSDENPLFRASFDGLTDDGVPVELKCPTEAVFAEVLADGVGGNAFNVYYPQVQQQIYVSGADHGWLVFWSERHDPLEFRIERDEEMIANLIQLGTDFYERVKSRRAPAKDPTRDCYEPETDEQKASWSTIADSLRETEKALKAATEEVKRLSLLKAGPLSRLVRQMGFSGTAEFQGAKITRRMQKGKVDYDALYADAGISADEINAYRKAPSSRVRISISGFDTPEADDEVDVTVTRWFLPVDPNEPAYSPSSQEEHAQWLASIAEIQQIEAQLAAYRAEIKRLTAIRTELSAPLLEMMGVFTRANFDGVQISRYLQRGFVNHEALCKDFSIDSATIEAFRAQPSLRVKVTIPPLAMPVPAVAAE